MQFDIRRWRDSAWWRVLSDLGTAWWIVGTLSTLSGTIASVVRAYEGAAWSDLLLVGAAVFALVSLGGVGVVRVISWVRLGWKSPSRMDMTVATQITGPLSRSHADVASVFLLTLVFTSRLTGTFAGSVINVTNTRGMPPVPWKLRWRDQPQADRRQLVKGDPVAVDFAECSAVGDNYVKGTWRPGRFAFLALRDQEYVLYLKTREGGSEDITREVVEAVVQLTHVETGAVMSWIVVVGFDDLLRPRVRVK